MEIAKPVEKIPRCYLYLMQKYKGQNSAGQTIWKNKSVVVPMQKLELGADESLENAAKNLGALITKIFEDRNGKI